MKGIAPAISAFIQAEDVHVKCNIGERTSAIQRNVPDLMIQDSIDVSNEAQLETSGVCPTLVYLFLPLLHP